MQPKDNISLDFEKFDFEKYKDKFEQYGYISYKFEENDGVIIYINSGGIIQDNDGIAINIIYPTPYFYNDYKYFYPDGKLKEKGRLGLRATRVGKWLECDEEGNCRIVDYDKNRKFTYEDVLKFMAKHKHIDLKTGEGREQLLTNYNYEQQVWNVVTTKGYLVGRNYVLDGNSGKILKDEVLPFVP